MVLFPFEEVQSYQFLIRLFVPEQPKPHIAFILIPTPTNPHLQCFLVLLLHLSLFQSPMASRTLTLLFLSLFLCLILSAFAHSGHDHDDDGGDESATTAGNGEVKDLRSKPLILVKIWCLILVFIGTFIGGISPYFFKWNEGFLVLGTQFAGGVFLGTAMMHFLSDANETFEDLTKKEYPFAFMLACVGFLLTMLADCVISYVFVKQKGSGGSAGDLDGQGSVEQGKGGPNDGIPKSQIQDHHGHHFANPSLSVTKVDSFGDSILLITALCFHSVFEGVAIGVAETKAEAWKALWTISLHKIFAAIAMGIALLRMLPNRPFLSCIAYAFAFAISSPIGVVVGIIIDATTEGAVADWIFAISMGLASGLFIYVSVNHLLSKGYAPLKSVTLNTPHHKFLAVLLGVGVISVVMIWDT